MAGILTGAGALGILWALVTLGVYISYRILDVADLTVEGSIALGAAVAAMLITLGVPPLVATLAAMLAGAAAGFVTGVLHTRLGIPALLAGILCMIALYSVNIRVMGFTANLSLLRQGTVLTPLVDAGLSKNFAALLAGGLCVLLAAGALCWFFATELGSAVRAAGANRHMARAQGIHTGNMTLLGLCISNGLVGLAGGLIAQYQGFSDVQMGSGAIVIGLASLIIGEVLFGKGKLWRVCISLVLGAVAYRLIIALVIEAGMPATDLKLFTAATVALALCLPKAKGWFAAKTPLFAKNASKGDDTHAEHRAGSQDLPSRDAE